MVHIISKRDGPRREEAAARALVEANRTTIAGIANHLSGGRRRQTGASLPTPEPPASGKLWFIPPSQRREANPYVRISLNGRVVLADLDSGRQLHFIGDIRGAGATRRLVLATRENGSFAPLEEELRQALADLDGIALPDEAAEERLEQVIGARIGLTWVGDKAP
jgi:hypothetical protein